MKQIMEIIEHGRKLENPSDHGIIELWERLDIDLTPVWIAIIRKITDCLLEIRTKT